MSMLKQAYVHFCKETKALINVQQKVSMYRSESISDCHLHVMWMRWCMECPVPDLSFLSCSSNALCISL